MSFAVDIYSSLKRFNSTKIPDSTTGVYARYYCEINSGCSIMNPVLVINKLEKPNIFKVGGTDASGSPFDDEYVGTLKSFYMFSFKRWYFITDIVFDNGFWYVSGSVDVLATYRSQISSSFQLVSRSSSVVDGTLIDTFMPIHGKPQIKTIDIPGISKLFPNNIDGSEFLYYAITVSNNDSARPRGMMTTYILNYSQLKALKSFLMSDPQSYVGNVTDVTPAMFKALFNPMQYITSCKAYTFQPSYVSGGTSIKVGYWDTGIASIGIADGSLQKFNFSVNIPEHPGAVNDAYKNLSPYCEIYLDFMPFFYGNLDTTHFMTSRVMNLYCAIDVLSGQGELVVNAQSDDGTFYPVQHFYSNVGIDVPLSQILSDYYTSAVQRTLTANSQVANSISRSNISLEMQKMANSNVAASKRDTISYMSNAVSGVDSLLHLSIGGAANAAANAANTQISATERNQNFGLATQQNQNNISALNAQRNNISAQGEYSAVTAQMPQVEITGQFSSIVQLASKKRVFIKYWLQSSPNIAMHGRPYMGYHTIGTIPGYIECVKPDFSAGLQVENGMVNNFMETGFYFE